MATSAFLPACGGRDSSELRRAVFWLYLRQEIYSACSQQRTVRADLESYTFDSLDTSLSVDLWLHKALWICAQTLQWAYGDEPTPARWRELCQLLEEWPNTRPSSFDPLYFKPRDPTRNLWFPEVTFATDEHGELWSTSTNVSAIILKSGKSGCRPLSLSSKANLNSTQPEHSTDRTSDEICCRRDECEQSMHRPNDLAILK